MEETERQENTVFAHKLPLEEKISRSSSIEFAIGQLVALRSDPTRVGAIINILPGTPENRYLVFLENTPSTYYASQLQHHELASPSLSITPLPVIGVPIKSSNSIDGWDSVLSILQMPNGVPVATVALNAAKNAGILATEIIGCFDDAVSKKITDYKNSLSNEVIEKVEKLKKDGWENKFDTPTS